MHLHSAAPSTKCTVAVAAVAALSHACSRCACSVALTSRALCRSWAALAAATLDGVMAEGGKVAVDGAAVEEPATAMRGWLMGADRSAACKWNERVSDQFTTGSGGRI